MKLITTFVLFIVFVVSLRADGLEALDPHDPANDAFTMMGDSRTQWILPAALAAGLSPRWEAWEFLGQYHSTALPKGRIQNIGWSGSKASEWVEKCQYDVFPCKSSEMAKRVVLMIGGNDVIDRAGEWQNLTSMTST